MFDFGWTSPHGVGPLTPVSENPEALDSTDEPLPYFDTTTSRRNFVEENDEIEEELEVIAPSAVPFTALFRCADVFDWILIVVGSLCAVVHGGSLVAYLHLFGKIIHLLSFRIGSSNTHELFNDFSQFALYIVYLGLSVFAASWIGKKLILAECVSKALPQVIEYSDPTWDIGARLQVWCWILTAERQTAVIRTKYVQVILNQNMIFFDTYGNNGDIVNQVLTDVQVIQCALGEKVRDYIYNITICLGALAIAFLNSWQIAFLALATGPLIFASSGITNIFLHKCEENLKDVYEQSASVAEEVCAYTSAK
ncbi:ABC transporter B family member 20-like protein [Tanacetum coccineum]